MSSIQKSTEELIECVKSGAAYKRYRKCEKALKKYPGLSDKLNKLRGDIYRLYDGSDSEELLKNTEELQKMYQEMHKIPPNYVCRSGIFIDGSCVKSESNRPKCDGAERGVYGK